MPEKGIHYLIKAYNELESDKKLVISHVCCEDRAKLVAEKIEANVKFGSVEIVKCAGLNSTYAANGGIIVSYSK